MPDEGASMVAQPGAPVEPVADRRPPRLEMRGITKRYPGVVANDHIDLDLREGEIHGLLGENGAGKSTLMNILYGLAAPDEGQILLDGEPVTIAGPNDAIARGISMVHQHFMLVPVLSVADNILLGAEIMSNPVFLDRREAHHAQPPQAARLHDGRVRGSDRVAVDPLRADPPPAPPLDGVVEPEDERPGGRERAHEEAPPGAAGGQRRPHGAAEHAVVATAAALLREAQDAPHAGHGAHAGREDGAEQERAGVAPGALAAQRRDR
jgi:ABC-type sugar transport system ATPase subunit